MDNPRNKMLAAITAVIGKRMNKYDAGNYAERLLDAVQIIENTMAEINDDADDGEALDFTQIMAEAVSTFAPEAIMDAREDIIEKMQTTVRPIDEDDILHD